MKKVVVIGAGASGLVTSIKASNKNNKVTLLEKNNICGKKILITGNGKCNYFNEDFTINHYNSNNLDILSNIITKDNKKLILDFWNNLGIIPKIKNNYYYPASNLAATIQNTLILEAKYNNVDIKTNTEVLDIDYINNKFIITTNNETIECDKLVMSSGSKAAPQTGSTGFGYDILTKFNHTIIEPLPSLVQLRSTGNFLKEWNGIRTDVKVKLYENNNLIKEEEGEIQLTDYGVSGICIFQLSGLVSRGLYNNKEERLTIDFLPYLNISSRKELVEYLDNRNNNLKDRTITELLEGMLNYKLINIILKQNKINNNKHWNTLSNKDKLNIAIYLKEFPLDILDTNSYNKCQVCTGGIPLSEININTMESLKQKDLYITGELLDVDGECGGYNLSFAWLSGLLAGNNISGDNND